MLKSRKYIIFIKRGRKKDFRVELSEKTHKFYSIELEKNSISIEELKNLY